MRSTLDRLFLATFAAAVATLSACGGGSSVDSSTSAPSPAAPAPGPAPAPAVNTSTALTGTTAYGVLGTSNARVAFVASGASVVPIVIEGAGIAIGSSAPAGMATRLSVSGVVPSVSLTFNADACAVDSNELKGVCIGYDSPRIAVLDLKTFATSYKVSDITVQEFDSGAGTTANSYSGGSCILCGVAADVGKKRFVVGGTGGFRVYSYGSTTPSATYAIPVGENFGFLPQPTGTSYIIAPEYEPAGGARLLRVVNLETGKTYAWTKHTDSSTDLGSNSGNFTFSDIDAAAVDLATRMIVLSTESSADFLQIDFGQATFDDTALTFTAPFRIAQPDPSGTPSRLTDVAVSTTGSVLLSHGEGAANLGVTQLPKAAGTGGTFASGTGALGTFDLNDPNFDRSACGAGYTFYGKLDPHGLGLYAGIDGGQRGLIVDSQNTCAAVIDLAAMVAAPHKTGDTNVIDTAAAAVKAAVKFVKLN